MTPQQAECQICGSILPPAIHDEHERHLFAPAPIEAQEAHMEQRMAVLEKRIELLEGHVHQHTGVPDELTDTPLVEGENNEGQTIWTSI